MFALTSGTTDKPKHIPVTDHFVQELQTRLEDLGTEDARRSHGSVEKGLRASCQRLAAEPNIRGNLVREHQWAGSRNATGHRAASVRGTAASRKDQRLDESSIHRAAIVNGFPRVGMIITANPLTLVSLAQLADQQKESLLRDLRDGTLTLPAECPGPIDQRLMRRIRRVDKQRCRELEQIVNRHRATAAPRLLAGAFRRCRLDGRACWCFCSRSAKAVWRLLLSRSWTVGQRRTDDDPDAGRIEFRNARLRIQLLRIHSRG